MLQSRSNSAKLASKALHHLETAIKAARSLQQVVSTLQARSMTMLPAVSRPPIAKPCRETRQARLPIAVVSGINTVPAAQSNRAYRVVYGNYSLIG